jgi:SAM-dependent methyltransferase
MTASRRARLRLLRVLVRSVGRTSDGIRLALDTGLTSGKTVDYVYRNRPSGRFGVGRWLDARFLRDPGWEAVRARRANLETLLAEAIRAVRASGRRVSLLDIASGPGLYDLATLERVGEEGVVARLRDIEERWLAEGRAEAARRGLAHVTFEQGDAFDPEQLARVEPRPNVVVSSGLYDWIHDDALVQRSIRMVHDALEPGGWFVVTNQASHPDLERAQALFTDQWMKPLDMRMREPRLLERWLSEAGFAVERTLADARGHYSVSAARKRG